MESIRIAFTSPKRHNPETRLNYKHLEEIKLFATKRHNLEPNESKRSNIFLHLKAQWYFLIISSSSSGV
jgi:hypothetical protein